MKLSRIASMLMLLVVTGAMEMKSSASELTPVLHLLPRPNSVFVFPQCPGLSLRRALSVSPIMDQGAREILDERWHAFGIPLVQDNASHLDIRVVIAPGPWQSYHLSIGTGGVDIRAADADGAFYAFVTLSQLAQGDKRGYSLPCVKIDDAPALRWRILSDDVSRGPLPTMRYFKERIRTIAAFKMNGYSPYMEHVFVDPKHPLPAPADGITSDQLRELDAYARRLHVAFIPDQQTLAHMHNTLRWERYESLAESPHGYLLTPATSQGEQYVQDIIGDELAAVPRPPFFHIGSDEPFDLGYDRSAALVARRGEGAVYTQHVVNTVKFVRLHSNARPMIWDDALARHPQFFSHLPKSLVFINWHYGAEKTFAPYIKRIADGGFEQMIAPGADNWNEIYPDINKALANIDCFVTEGKAAKVLGIFQTVWHDDGETLFEATWYPLLYAASSSWEHGHLDPDRFAADFPWTFFGSADRRYGDDIAALAKARTLLPVSGDPLFWSDAFDPGSSLHLISPGDLATIRLISEGAITHLRMASTPVLHPNAAAVIDLAARRYDLLARTAQIAPELRETYEEAGANGDGQHDALVYRDLFAAKYLMWEQRDAFLEIEPRVRAAWEYENRSIHELSVLERYHLVAQRAITRADAIDRATYAEYRRGHKIPPLDELFGLPCVWESGAGAI